MNNDDFLAFTLCDRINRAHSAIDHAENQAQPPAWERNAKLVDSSEGIGIRICIVIFQILSGIFISTLLMLVYIIKHSTKKH